MRQYAHIRAPLMLTLRLPQRNPGGASVKSSQNLQISIRPSGPSPLVHRPVNLPGMHRLSVALEVHPCRRRGSSSHKLGRWRARCKLREPTSHLWCDFLQPWNHTLPSCRSH